MSEDHGECAERIVRLEVLLTSLRTRLSGKDDAVANAYEAGRAAGVRDTLSDICARLDRNILRIGHNGMSARDTLARGVLAVLASQLRAQIVPMRGAYKAEPTKEASGE